MDTLDKFVTVARRRPRPADAQGRSAGPAGVRDAARAPGARRRCRRATSSRRRGRSSSRSSPSTTTSPSATSGCPGMIGALGACFGRVVTMDSPRARPPGEFQWEATLWHELAHVITLQMSNQRVPRWLTEGISVYEEKRARPEWGREMDVEFAGMLNRGETLKLRDLNAAFTNPQTISLAYYQASLLVEHIVDDVRRRRAAQAAARLRRGPRHRRRAEDGAQHRFRPAAGRLRPDDRADVRRRCGARWRCPTECERPAKMPLDALQTLAARAPATAIPVQVALGAALRKAGDDRRGDAGVRARGGARADGDAATTARNAQIAADRAREEGPRAGDRRAAGARRRPISTTSRRRGSWRSLMREAGVDRSREARSRSTSASPPSIRSTPTRTRCSAGWRCERNDAGGGDRASSGPSSRSDPVDQAAAHTDLAESYFKSGQRAEAKKQTLAALEIAPSYERAQDLLLKLVGGSRP